MSKETVEQELERTGWEVDYGFSGYLLIANAGALSLLASWWALHNPVDAEYELYDVQRDIVCPVGAIPTPLQAAMLLEEHGEPATSCSSSSAEQREEAAAEWATGREVV